MRERVLTAILFALFLALPPAWGQQVNKTMEMLPQTTAAAPNDIFLVTTGVVGTARSTRGITTSSLLQNLAQLPSWPALVSNGLPATATLQGNLFNGPSQLLQLDSSDRLPALDGSLTFNLNAGNIASGTLSDSRLNSDVTKQGNTFNGASQLIQLDSSTRLPAVNGSQLTSLSGGNVTASSLPLSAMANETALSVLGNLSGSPATPSALTALPESFITGLTTDLAARPQFSTFYVATNGVSSGPGTTPAQAWSETYAVANAGASNTLVFLPGVYNQTLYLGTPSIHSGLTFKSQVKWGAQLIGGVGSQTVIGDVGVSNLTFDGFNIGPSYIDCVKFYGGIGNTLRNCWIHDGAHGNPAWVTNNTGSFEGSGILALQSVNLLVENCLIENNGAFLRNDHGIYASGTNGIIRNCVLRYNCGCGIQVADSTPGTISTGFKVFNNLVVLNFIFVDSGSIQVLFYGYDPGSSGLHPTNYFYGNTIIATNQAYAVMAQFGCQLMATNNTIICPFSSGALLGQSGSPIGQIFADYNVVTNSLGSSGVVAGGHGVTTTFSALSFVNPAKGLYWLGPTSSARNAALGFSYGVDFFGASQNTVSDAGPFQFDASLATDVRVMDPSPIYGADYWSKPVLKDLTNFTTSVTFNGGLASAINSRGSLMSSNVGTGTWSFTNSDSVNWQCLVGGIGACAVQGVSVNDSKVFVGNSTNICFGWTLQPGEWLRITNTTAPGFNFKRF